MSDELKPCPFCGGPGYLCQIPSASGGDRYIWIAKCSAEDGCGVEFLGTSRKVDAIKEWNTRVDDAKLKLAERLFAESTIIEGKGWSISNHGNLAKLVALRQYDDGGNVLSYTHHDSVLEAFTALRQIGEQQK